MRFCREALIGLILSFSALPVAWADLHPDAHISACEQYLSFAGNSLSNTAQKALTEGVAHVSAKQYKEWQRSGLSPLRQNVFELTYGKKVFGPQEVLHKKDFNRSEQDLIARLQKLQHSNKLTKRYKRKYFALEKDKAEALHEVSDGVEVGAWRIMLKSGRVITAIMTSSHYGLIRGAHNEAALMKVLHKNKAGFEDIAIVQYFHTHPRTEEAGVAPLSDADFSATTDFFNLFSPKNPEVRIHMYAITQTRSGVTVVFHHGAN